MTQSPSSDQHETESAPDTSEVKEKEQQEPSTEREPQLLTITDVELERLQEELKDYKNKYFLLLAESENLRKRLTKEKDEHVRHTAAKVLIEFLPPLDNMENALHFAETMSDEVRNWAIGFQMILNQFKEVLEYHGVHPLHVEHGVEFNPHEHEAVEMVETNEHAPGLILEQCAKGYKMGERTLRPVRVKVTRSPTPPEVEGTNEEPAPPVQEDSGKSEEK